MFSIGKMEAFVRESCLRRFPAVKSRRNGRPGDDDSSKSLKKAMSILSHFRHNPGEMGITEIALALGINKSTVYRLLAAMKDFDFIEQLPNGKYQLGLGLFELGTLAVQSRGLQQQQARDRMMDLCNRTGETVHLAILRDGDVVYLEKLEARSSLIAIPTAVGRRFPAHCTGLGKVMLSHFTQTELEHFFATRQLQRFTDHTITSKPKLLKELSRVREQGYAIDDQEVERGLTCVAAPVRNHKGRVIAAISVAGPSLRFEGEELGTKIAMLMESARDISWNLGYRKDEPALSPRMTR
jgi:DNA-binding IclR family transcriptional regulator